MQKAIDKTVTGQCLCGAIKYEVNHIEPNMGHCHCSMCRKFHGAAFATFGEAKKENFHWLQGESFLADYVADNGTRRQFCKVCGSSMTFAPSVEAVDPVEFSLGTLDSDLDMKPDAHIYVGSKANWVEICDGLPEHDAGRNEE